MISIHALCEEGDEAGVVLGRPWSEFLSTPSARRATVGNGQGLPGIKNFYPRPLRGGRRSSMYSSSAAALFLSTPSARRATDGWYLRQDII